MWILKFLPDWIFYAILLVGLLGLLFSRLIPAYYRTAVIGVSAFLFIGGVYMSGAISNNNAWEARVKELEVKLAQAEAESQKENVKIVEKIVYKNKIVVQQRDDIIKFIDREVVKYDNQCVIPKEFVEAHNKAARGVK